MGSHVSEIVNHFFLIVAALFPIINPAGDAPIFLALTNGSSSQECAELAKQIARNCFFLLVASVLVGSYVLDFFGISVPIVRIGGGLLVIANGWKLISTDEPTEGKDDVAAGSTSARAFYPLSFPLTVGPGAISVAISLSAGRSTPNSWWAEALSETLGALVLAITIYLCYRFAHVLMRILGPNGATVLLRLSAFILLCIGVQILWGGVSELVLNLAAELQKQKI